MMILFPDLLNQKGKGRTHCGRTPGSQGLQTACPYWLAEQEEWSCMQVLPRQFKGKVGQWDFSWTSQAPRLLWGWTHGCTFLSFTHSGFPNFRMSCLSEARPMWPVINFISLRLSPKQGNSIQWIVGMCEQSDKHTEWMLPSASRWYCWALEIKIEVKATSRLNKNWAPSRKKKNFND